MAFDTSINMDQYIIDNLDRALEKGWVRVYYQPVIRTLTKELCGMEALARWLDPELGLLPPAVFIRPLEEAKKIHLLDLRILELVCENYVEVTGRGEVTVPVSFNLSKYDFEACDIVSLVDACVNEHGMPHHMLHIEITESLLGQNPHYMYEQINRLHELGYEVWMDDFGSEYSSLNILKDFDFDELKIDMKFLSDFSIRSRKIITSVVDMAKTIEMQTLAEGVETEEQFQFLRTIGCEKTQGYYFGRPLPYDESVAGVESKGISIEPLDQRSYHSRIGRVNFMDATLFLREDIVTPGDEVNGGQIPLAIVEVSGGKATYILVNEEYIEQYRSIKLRSVDEDPNAPLEVRIPLYSHFFQLAERAAKSERVENLDFAMNGYFCNAKVRLVSSWEGGYAVLCTFANMSSDSNVLRQKKLDDALRMLYSVYDRVDLFHVGSHRLENLYVSNRAVRLDSALTLEENFSRLLKEDIHPEDRDRYEEFINMETVLYRMAAQRTNFVSDKFRIRNIKGIYTMVVQVLVPTFGDTELEVLSYFRSAGVEGDFGKTENLEGEDPNLPLITEELLWRNLTEHASFGVFWKDRNRRFLGVNQTFLDYYGIRAAEDIIGKTDEDMGWHVDPGPFKSDEMSVLEDGEFKVNVPGHCITNGVNRDIVATKMPLFRDGEIVGLIGYFLDVTEHPSGSNCPTYRVHIDSVTGLLDVKGLEEESLDYTESYLVSKVDYALICVVVPEIESLESLYGRDWIKHLLHRITEEIRSEVGVTGVIARSGENMFSVLRQFHDRSEVIELEDMLKHAISGVSLVEGVKFKLHPSSAFSIYSEIGDIDQMIALTRRNARKNPE